MLKHYVIRHKFGYPEGIVAGINGSRDWANIGHSHQESSLTGLWDENTARHLGCHSCLGVTAGILLEDKQRQTRLKSNRKIF